MAYTCILACGILLSHKNNIAVYRNMDGPGEHCPKWFKSEKDKCYITCMWQNASKQTTNESILESGSRLIYIENKLTDTKKEGERGRNK